MQGLSPQKVLPGFAPSEAEPPAQTSSPFHNLCDRLARRATDARRRHSDRFVHQRQPHPEAHANRSRPIRSTRAANSWRGTATSASWKIMYVECVTTFAPILTKSAPQLLSGQAVIRHDTRPVGCSPARGVRG